MSNLQRTPPPPVGGKNKTAPIVNKRQRTDDEFSAESDANGNSITLNGMMRTMMEQFNMTRELIDAVRDEIKVVNEKIDIVKAELKSEISSVKEECTAKFQHHDTVLESLNKRMTSIHHQVGALHNRNELIISGIPFTNGENLNSTLQAIGRHLAVNSSSLMAEPRRMKSSSGSDGDGLIRVEFALKTTRDEFYNAYLRKRDLKLKDIGLDSMRRVYINESLTVEARKLKSVALQLKKAGKLVSVYTKMGSVHVKPAVDEPPVVIQTEAELDKYK